MSNEPPPIVAYAVDNWERFEKAVLAKNPGINKYNLWRMTKEVAFEAWNAEPPETMDGYWRSSMGMTEEECMACIGNQGDAE